MNRSLARLVTLAAVTVVALSVRVAVAQDELGPSDATLLRVFLKDGTSLTSYGEFARVNDRVVFSMPTSMSLEAPQLHLVTLSADHVDWERTNRYADTARAARYVALHGEQQYAMLAIEIGQALNDVTQTQDPRRRLEIVERARKTLADWPGYHFNYKAAEIQQMVATLDAVIAELRVAAGLAAFDLNFVAGVPPAREPLLRPPTPREAIEQILTAARLSDSPAERLSLLSVALGTIERNAELLPSDLRTSVRATIRAHIAAELEIDRAYQAMTAEVLQLASARARAADVRGVQRLLERVPARDRALGAKRPDAVLSLVTAVEAELDAARRLRLARDRWALRLPELRKYYDVVTTPLERLRLLESSLEDIKTLAGSTPMALSAVERVTKQILEVVSPLVPPEEFAGPHALLVSAAQLANSAAYIRREAVLSGDIARAWDASSAAAGALMLGTRARTEMRQVLQSPQAVR